ncbi:MAG: alkaline phosphatase family protein [Actinomycetota bacterium]|nr:alkaline phosphatase family protein [Actinomycetota bacterium]
MGIHENILNEPNLLDLSKKIFNAVLNDDFFIENKEIPLSSSIYEAENINFIIADGLGSKNIEETDSFFNKFNAGYVNSTFPSSTNVALSTVNLVSEPINTGMLGYFQFDKQKYGLINALNWSQENEKMLEDGFFQENKTIWTILKEKNIFANNIQPKDLENSALSKYIYRDSNQINYKDEDELVDLVKNTSILENRFNFIYYPKIDIAAHVFGVGSKEWQKELNIFEDIIETINKSNIRKTYTIITADHGLLNVDSENRYYLEYPDTVEIFGDQRAVYANGSEKEIKKVFENVPGKFLSSDELELFLGKNERKYMNRLIPDFCFLVDKGNIIYPKHLKADLVGYHGGLTEEEMKIPLIEFSNC